MASPDKTPLEELEDRLAQAEFVLEQKRKTVADQAEKIRVLEVRLREAAAAWENFDQQELDRILLGVTVG